MAMLDADRSSLYKRTQRLMAWAEG